MCLKQTILVGLLAAGLLTGCGSQGSGISTTMAEKQDEPVVVTVWNYYNGPQNEEFEHQVQQFNDTVGREQNIIVESVSMGALKELMQTVSDSVKKKAGAESLPSLCAAYTDMAFKLNQKGLLADMKPYLTEEELAAYVDAYLEEGRFVGDGTIKIFPMAKSTEVMTINQTAWEPFAAETGTDLSELSTWEGVAAVAERYFQWTDGKTPETVGDGKAFFGRDAFANYLLVGSRQLGHELFTMKDGIVVLDFDRDTMKKLWDYYYVPFVRGYYVCDGRFRSEDLKTGRLIACVGSTSGAPYTPDTVVHEDGSREPITCSILPLPNFAGTKPMAVQQGAGMVLFEGDDRTEQAAMEFLTWFTGTDVNLEFCLKSGYLPVTWEADIEEYLNQELKWEPEFSEALRDNLLTGMEMTKTYELCTMIPFENGTEARGVLDTGMTDRAEEDRKLVERMLAGGMTLEEAVEQLDPDARFEIWYKETEEGLHTLIK